MYLSIRYHFIQHFHVPAVKVYNWCTHYDPQDPVLMLQDAERRIRNLSGEVLVLTDIYHSEAGNTEKQRLVILYPGKLSWISTHITGPNRHSQFLYRILPESENESHLEFTGLHVERIKKNDFDEEKISKLSERLKDEDSSAWKLLAKEMERELSMRS